MYAHHGFPSSLEDFEQAVPQRPSNPSEAKGLLLRGHENFRQWVDRIHESGTSPPVSQSSPRAELIQSLFPNDRVPQQEPFAIAIGCADARVPLRMLLGSTINDLFEIRVAGQVLADECVGSMEYAIQHLPSVKSVVVLGHSDCGAVKTTVDSYLKPCCLETSELSIGLESIVNHIFGSVVQSERAILATNPDIDRNSAKFRDQLLQTSILVNAALIAHRIEFLLKQMGRGDIGVLFGVYEIQTHSIVHPDIQSSKPSYVLGLAESPPTTAAVADWAIAAALSTTQK